MRRLLTVGGLTAALVVVPAAVASAHPLGNFSVNHYHGLTLNADQVSDLAVIDAAEIPTEQARGDVDTDGDGTASPAERAAYAASSCTALAQGLHLTVDDTAVTFALDASSYGYHPGAAGLRTSRLTCRLSAPADFGNARTVAFADDFRDERVGWHEITATTTAGVHLDRSPVPARSISDELRHYPNDLLSSPLDVRSVTLHTLPGAGPSTFIDSVNQLPGAGPPVARVLASINQRFTDLVGTEHLSLGVGLLAVLLSLVLGAGHAAMPGHGKTVMAAYLAGRRGSTRDALTVGATVTLTHTAGVLGLGLALTLSTSLAGEGVLRWAGVLSGLLVAGIGAGLLAGVIRNRRRHAQTALTVPAIAPTAALAVAGAPAPAPATTGAAPGHGHPHPHGLSGHGHSGHGHSGYGHSGHGHPHPHGHSGHGHSGHGHGHAHGQIGRGGLVGMGVAGGLVPSPSALVVLLAAIALGRTVFGVILVLGYGAGLAATLTAAGLLLIKLRKRADSGLRRRAGSLAEKWGRLVPPATAAVVLVLGLGLALRSLMLP